MITADIEAARPGAQEMRSLRRQHQVTIEELAPRLGLTPTTLAARERGERGLWEREDVTAYTRAVKALARHRRGRLVRATA